MKKMLRIFTMLYQSTNTKDIKEFSDIKLTDYTKMEECNDKKAPWGAPIIGDASKRKDSLFIKYGTHFSTMIKMLKIEKLN